ncbi:MAG TPA: hypothetical protein VIG48_09220 [Jatrophihabitans sp.]
MEPDQADVPDLLRKRPAPPRAEPQVGEFRQGSAASQWALGRYLVGRAITDSAGWALLLVGIVVLVLGALAEFASHLTFLAVVLVVLGLGVLVLRWALLATVRRLTGFERFGPLEGRMRALVDDTSSDVLRELRRIGLPGHLLTLTLLAFRFFGRRRRKDTVARLREFDTTRAVPRARLDEVHLLLREAFGRRVGPRRDWQTGGHD